MLHELADNSSVPVINGMTKLSHPCQVLADVMTFEEKQRPHQGPHGRLDRRLQQRAGARGCTPPARFGFALRVATPKELAPRETLREWAQRRRRRKCNSSTIRRRRSDGADCVVTDTWVSMGDEDTTKQRHNLLKPYQVNERLMSRAAKDAIFMHCLPAHRGEEVTDEVIDGPQSVVFDEAENRLHAQKAVLTWALG